MSNKKKTLWKCPCGCDQHVYKEGEDIYVESRVIIKEKIEFIDYHGFINGRWSIRSAGIRMTELYLKKEGEQHGDKPK